MIISKMVLEIALGQMLVWSDKSCERKISNIYLFIYFFFYEGEAMNESESTVAVP